MFTVFLVLPLRSHPGGEFGPHRHLFFGRRGNTLGLLDITHTPFRTAVHLILTAHGLWHGTAFPLALWVFTACGSIRTLGHAVAAQNRRHELFSDAGAAVIAALVALWTAVFPIGAGDSLSEGTAAIFCQGLQTGELRWASRLIRTDVVVFLPRVGLDHPEGFRESGLICRGSFRPGDGHGGVHTAGRGRIAHRFRRAAMHVILTALGLIERAAFVAVDGVVAAGLIVFTSSSIWTFVCTDQGQQSPTHHNPQVHLEVCSESSHCPRWSDASHLR